MPDKSTDPSASRTTGDATVAVVTGAAGGIGREIVRGLLRRGWTVGGGVRSLERSPSPFEHRGI